MADPPAKPPQRPQSLLNRPRRPTGQIDLRRSPRVRVAASVLIDHAGKTARLPLVNVSATGALIATGVTEPRLRVGALLFMTLTAEGYSARGVEVNARVIRMDAEATAVDWSDDATSVDAVGQLLARVAAPPAPR